MSEVSQLVLQISSFCFLNLPELMFMQRTETFFYGILEMVEQQLDPFAECIYDERFSS